MWKVGDKLGRFQLEREIGQGSHGVVFVARDTALDTPVAVKILHPWLTQDTAVRDRFKRELLLARRISHQGVCRLFDLHEEGDAFFITMEYVEGQTLLNILKNEGRLQPLRAIKILRGVCQGLAAAHTAGVIHRDLKPANIIVRAGDQPMILDFGTATAADVSRVTRPGTAVGSMRFIAPEIFTGVAPSWRTDLYSLGVVAYVTIAGKLPYNAASGAIEMLDMIKNQPPQRLDTIQADVPKGLADAIARSMDKNPDTRFQSVLELDAALGAVEIQLEGPSSGDIARWAPAPPVGSAFAQQPSTGSQAAPQTTPEAAAVPTDPPQEPATLPTVPRLVSAMERPAATLVTPSPFATPHSAPGAPPAGETTRVSPIQAGIGVSPPPPPHTVVDKGPNLTLGSIAPEERSMIIDDAFDAAFGSATDVSEPPAVAQDGTGDLPVITGDLPVITGAPSPSPGADEDVRTSITGIGPGDLASINASQFQSIHDGTPATTEHTAVVRDFPMDPLPQPSGDGGDTATDAAPPEDAVPPLDAEPVASFRPEPTMVVQRAELDDPDEPSISRITGARTKRRAAAAIAALGALAVIGLIYALISGDDGADPTTEDAGFELAAADAGDAPQPVDAGAPAVAEVIDAGVAAEPVDAGALAALIIDAGAEPDEADAGDEGLVFGEEGEGEDEIDPVKPPPDRPPPRRSPVEDAVRTVKAKMLQKGFIPGDVPAADAALRKAMAAKARPGDGMGHVKDAQKAVDAQAIDRVFVMQKLARFNTKYQAAKKKNPKLADRVEPLSRAAAEAFAKSQFPQANKKLNQGFAAVGK
jgi:serine/threonine protein kinase